MSKIKVSVISVCLNAEDSIRQTLTSVAGQTYSSIEYLVVNGGSTDTTLQTIEEFRDHIDILISEPDTGLYNAMNKGIRAATGDVLYFLNADDCFCDSEVVEDVAAEFKNSPTLDWVYGNVLTEGDGKVIRMSYADHLTRKSIMLKGFCHQSLFARKRTFDRVEGFDEKFRIAADIDWVLKNLKLGVNNCRVNRDIAKFRHGGLSESTNWREENLRIRKKHFSAWEFFYWKQILKRIRKKNKGELIKDSSV